MNSPQGDDDVVNIYTDGSCLGNPGPGGWGAVMFYKSRSREISGSEAEPETTNNRMELTAAIAALKQLKRPCRVKVHTDSEYLRRGMVEWLPEWQRRNWQTAKKKPVKNAGLWQDLVDAVARHKEVKWQWVRGHSGHPQNERADELAQQAARQAAWLQTG